MKDKIASILLDLEHSDQYEVSLKSSHLEAHLTDYDLGPRSVDVHLVIAVAVGVAIVGHIQSKVRVQVKKVSLKTMHNYIKVAA